MEIHFYNGWLGNSMKPGGAFPVEFISLYADLNKGWRHFSITIINFCLEVSFDEDERRNQRFIEDMKNLRDIG